MDSGNKKFWGIVLIAVGVAFLLDRTHILNFDLFFPGWWTLFLIVPALASMIKSGLATGNVILLGIGVYFLLEEQGINLSYLVLPAVLILWGAGMLIGKKH
jgi:hypothetical protein